MKLPSSILAALVLACALVTGAAAVESPDDDTPSAARPTALSPWWSVFGDPTLDRLLGDGQLQAMATRDRQLDLQAQACALYLRARIHAARFHIAVVSRQAAQRQWLLLGPRQRTDGDPGRTIASALRQATEREHRLAELRTESVEQLATLLAGRWTPAELAALLAPVLGDATLPLPAFDVPASLPGLVLRQRTDVAAAEATLLRADEPAGTRHLRLALYLQALSESIGPDDANTARAGSVEDSLGAVLQAARADVSARLERLAAQGDEVRMQSEDAQSLASQYQLVLQGYRDGRVPEMDALSGLQQLLAQQDRLATSLGRAGLAWITLQQGIGGAGEARTSDLLGSGSPSSN